MKKTRKLAGNTSIDRKFISFFSGALGLDIGLEKSGLNCLSVNDVDSVACETMKANKVHAHLYDCDIRDISPARLEKDLAIEPEDLFAIVGGPPCQAFSTAGRRLGLNDERGNVFLHFIELIRALRPKYAVFENVRGLLSAALFHRPLDQRGKGNQPLRDEEKPGGALLHIIKLLEDAAYSTTFTLYNTANFGIPQVRERLIFFASRDGKKIPFMTPTHDERGVGGLPKWRTLKDAIGHLQGRPFHAGKFPERRLRFYELLKAGQNWRDLPSDLQPIALGAAWNSGGGRTGFYRRLAWNKPAPTLVTRPTMPATDLCHPTELRPLSVEEYAAIQTFPRNYVFAGNLDDQYRQIGNAVPCEFGEAIGRHLIAFDDGRLSSLNGNGKFSRYDGTDHESWRQSVANLERQYRLSLFSTGVPNIG
jgi:DNA (cytosine-5)-methyltransferase 1